MSSDLQLLNAISTKAGLPEKPGLTRRASELLRLLRSKNSLSAAQLGVTATSMAVICLHLSSVENQLPVDLVTMQKLAGCKSKQHYSSLKQTLAAAIGVNNCLTIEAVCVKLGCPQMRAESLNLLQSFIHHHKTATNSAYYDDINFQSAVFVCASVAAVCQNHKVRLDKRQLLELSAAKRGVLYKAIDDMCSFSKNLEQESAAAVTSPAWHGDLQAALSIKADRLRDDQREPVAQRRPMQRSEQEEQQDFEQWKAAMLAQAQEASLTRS